MWHCSARFLLEILAVCNFSFPIGHFGVYLPERMGVFGHSMLDSNGPLD